MKALLMLMMVAALLCGCAGFSPDGGFDNVAAATRTHLSKDLAWPRSAAQQSRVQAQVNELLAQPLTADGAVQVALLNSPALRAAFEELGISEADLVQSDRLPNPRFDLRHASAAGQFDIEETLSFNILSLLTVTYAHDIEKRHFAQTQNATVLRVIQLAEQSRQAFYAAVAAQQSLQYLQHVNDASATSAELARRMVAAGNWNQLDLAREQIFHADAARGLQRAQLQQLAALERLARLMGLQDPQTGERPALQLADRLPELPADIAALPNIETTLLEKRIDLQLLRMQIDALSHRLKLTKATRFVNVLDLGPTRVQQGSDQSRYETGYALSLQIPLFDSGAARVKKSEAIYAQAVDRFAQAAVDARSQIRQAYAGYRAGFELARRQRDEVMPLRRAVAEQNLLRYNASLISIFELLADAQQQVVSADESIQSLRDFWIAKSQLDAALLGPPAP